MAEIKTITHADSPKHPIIKALAAAGFTDIELQWRPLHSYPRGWHVVASSRGYLKLGLDISASLNIINQLQKAPKK